MSLYDKASDNYAIALIAFQKKKYNAAASRLYYALYQACVKKHMENGRVATDFMSAQEKISRKDSLKSQTDAPKWPHDVLTRYASLNTLGLSATQRLTITQARKSRVIGDYGDMDTVTDKDMQWLMDHVMDVFRQLRVPIARR